MGWLCSSDWWACGPCRMRDRGGDRMKSGEISNRWDGLHSCKRELENYLTTLEKLIMNSCTVWLFFTHFYKLTQVYG